MLSPRCLFFSRAKKHNFNKKQKFPPPYSFVQVLIMAERPEDLNLPSAVVTRIVKDALPPSVKVSKEANAAVAKAASVFVLYATSCANNVALKSNRKTLHGADVIQVRRDFMAVQGECCGTSISATVACLNPLFSILMPHLGLTQALSEGLQNEICIAVCISVIFFPFLQAMKDMEFNKFVRPLDSALDTWKAGQAKKKEEKEAAKRSKKKAEEEGAGAAAAGDNSKAKKSKNVREL